MTTDNKTLADVQPGGRVRLGDADPMRSALEDALQFVETLHSTVSGDSRKIVWRCLERGRAALSAQPSPGETLPPEMRLSSPDYLDYLDTEPSPGGQGDALATLSARWRACADQHDENAREADSIGDMTATVQYLEMNAEALRQAAAELDAALAARQPVGEPDAWVPDKFFGPGVNAMTARRKPSDAAIAAHGLYVPLYRHPAPPAQAVDLGGLREMLESWKNSDYPFSYEGQCAQRALDACVADLKGWLDSQAVGE